MRPKSSSAKKPAEQVVRSRKLERGELPLSWKAQREMLGFG